MNKTADISERILVLTPTGNDAANAVFVLQQAGLTGVICHGCSDLVQKYGEGAGALLVAEEALTSENAGCFIEILKGQPQWSDIPLLIITSANDAAQAGQTLLTFFAPYGNVTLIERPLRAISLVSALQVALRARRRQYEIRGFLEQEKKNLATIQQSEERFRAIADNIPQLAWMTDPTGWITWYNQRWFDYTGTTLEQMEGWGWQMVHHPEHTARVVATWKRALEAGEPWEDTFPLRGKEGQYRWFLSRAFPIRDAAGNVTRWFGTNTDVTELRETQHALRHVQGELQQHAANLENVVAERTAKLHETISELEAFSYSVSHDLRAPLRAMQGYSQFLLEDYADKLDETGHDYVTRIVKAAERLDRLVTDILTYSRVTRADIKKTPVDLEKLIHDVIQGYPALHSDQADIEIKRPLLKVIGHEGSLTQCISNLLDNAVKFVPENRKPHVIIWTERRNERVRIYFQDNGIGISREHQERIFRMFEKAPSEKNFEGTGIGLAIVRKAVERMGGHLGVESEANRGSRFWIELPPAS